MKRNLLIIHESFFLQKLLASYALSELTDVFLEVASKAEAGLEMANLAKFDIVVSAMEMSGMDGLELFGKLRDGTASAACAFVLVTSTDTPDQRKRIKAAGVEHVLITPCSAQDFASVVNQAANPRYKREDDRFSIPDCTAMVRIGDAHTEIRVINLSQNGAYCETTYQQNDFRCLQPRRMDIIFPAEFGHARAEGITALLLRLNVMSFREDNVPHLIRMAFKFIEVPEAAANILGMVIEKIKKDLQLG